MLLAKCYIGTSSDSNSGGESTPIIAGSVGGAAVFFIIILCVVILYVRRSHKKRSHEFDNKMMIEMNSDVKMNTNPYRIALLSKTESKKINMIMCYRTKYPLMMMYRKL